MKIIHCADLHLDLKMLSGLDAEKRKIKRLQLLQNFFNLIEYAEKNDVQVIMLCGDIFDTQEPTKRTVNLIKKAIINHPKITFLYIWGNHDSRFHIFEEEELSKNFIVFDEHFSSVDFDDEITIGGVSAIRTLDANFYSSIKFEKDRFNILMLHEPINASDDYFSGVYTYNLANKNIDYLALGHIHQTQGGKIDSRGVWQYCGCLEGRSFNDVSPLGTKKGFFLLDIKMKKLNSTFVPLSKFDYRIVEIDIDEKDDHFKVLEKIKSVTKFLGADDIVRVVLKGRHKEENPIQTELIFQNLEKNFFHFEIQDETETNFDFEKYSKETFSLKGEFLRTVKASELTNAEKDKISLIGIEALKGEDISL